MVEKCWWCGDTIIGRPLMAKTTMGLHTASGKFCSKKCANEWNDAKEADWKWDEEQVLILKRQRKGVNTEGRSGWPPDFVFRKYTEYYAGPFAGLHQLNQPSGTSARYNVFNTHISIMLDGGNFKKVIQNAKRQIEAIVGKQMAKGKNYYGNIEYTLEILPANEACEPEDCLCRISYFGQFKKGIFGKGGYNGPGGTTFIQFYIRKAVQKVITGKDSGNDDGASDDRANKADNDGCHDNSV